MAVFFTADTHFGHTNIINYCKRPFYAVEVMDETMIAAWNAKVRHDDTVYHLGDFAFGRAERAESILSRLNGRKYLIRGNHDSQAVQSLSDWESVQDYGEIRDPKTGSLFVLSHYPMRVWNKSHQGSLMLYGHVHGTLPDQSNSIDVGVDTTRDYAPLSIPEILARTAMAGRDGA